MKPLNLKLWKNCNKYLQYTCKSTFNGIEKKKKNEKDHMVSDRPL